MYAFFVFLEKYRKEFTWVVLVLNALAALISLLSVSLFALLVHITLVIGCSFDLIDHPKKDS